MTTRVRVALLTALAQTDGTLGWRRIAATFHRTITTELSRTVVQFLRRRGTIQHIQQCRCRRRSYRSQQELRRTINYFHFLHVILPTYSLIYPKSKENLPVKKKILHTFHDFYCFYAIKAIREKLSTAIAAPQKKSTENTQSRFRSEPCTSATERTIYYLPLTNI